MQILLIGAGKMGSAILNSWNFVLPENYNISVVEKNVKIRNLIKKRYKRYQVTSKIPSNWQGDFLLLAVKPQNFNDIVQIINKSFIKTDFIITLMAGLKTNLIKKKLKISSGIIRIMPNIATEISESMTCVFSKSVINKNKIRSVENILRPLGKVAWVKRENLIDSITAISGSGPAYFFLFLQILHKISLDLGFNKELSNTLIIQTAVGSIEMVKKEKNFSKLIKAVTSKGGTTEAALSIFFSRENNLEKILRKGVLAAKKKSEQIANKLNYE